MEDVLLILYRELGIESSEGSLQKAAEPLEVKEVLSVFKILSMTSSNVIK